MRFRKRVTEAMAARIVELGLSECPVCHTGAILISRQPAHVSTGGFHYGKGDPRNDPDANVIFAVQLTCDVCGYLMLFDSEKFYTGNDRIFINGPLELEDEIEAAQDD